MIKSEKGHTQMKGNAPGLLVDLAVIVSALKDCGIERDDIEHAVGLAFKSEEEIGKETEDLKKKCAVRILKEIMEGLDEAAEASYKGTEESD